MKAKAGTITVHVPLKVATRGGRKLIIVEGEKAGAAVVDLPSESAVVKLLAQGFRWKAMLKHDYYSSIADLARAQNVKVSYVYGVLRLTLLAPRLVEAILDGKMRCPAGQLRISLPVLWNDQLTICDGGY